MNIAHSRNYLSWRLILQSSNSLNAEEFKHAKIEPLENVLILNIQPKQQPPQKKAKGRMKKKMKGKRQKDEYKNRNETISYLVFTIV